MKSTSSRWFACIRAATFLTALWGGSALAQSTTLLVEDFEFTQKPVSRIGSNNEDMKYLWWQGLGGNFTGTDGTSTDTKVSGSRSFKINVTSGDSYLIFGPNDGNNWHNLREYQMSNIVNNTVKWSGTRPDWKYNYYNRMRFWIKVPPGMAYNSDGDFNLHVGTYSRKSTAPLNDAESGGGHWYHYYNIPYTGEWHQVIVDTHPHHQRGFGGSTEWGDRENMTGEANYNYFDAMTWFYITSEALKLKQFPAAFYYDRFELFHEDNSIMNMKQIYGMSSVYVPSTNTIRVEWSRDKGQPGDSTKHEVRYSYSDAHALGWDNLTPAPNGIVSPKGYNGMTYSTTAINTTGKSVVYIAIKPQNSTMFRQIAVPIPGPAAAVLAPRAPGNLTVQ